MKENIKKIINKYKKQYLENTYIYYKETWNIYMDMLYQISIKEEKTGIKNEKREKIEKIINKLDIKINRILYKIWETI